jgi:hypothetical protein
VKDSRRPQSGGSETSLRRWSVALAIALPLCCLPVAACILGEFIWTDQSEIIEGTMTFESARGLLGFVMHGSADAYYRPTVAAANSLNAWLSGKSAVAFRAANYVGHCVNVLLLLGLGRALGMPPLAALLAAALFAIHPLAVTPVSWSADRSDLLATSALLGSLWLSVRYASDGGLWWAPALLGFLVGVAAKITAAAAASRARPACAHGAHGQSRSRSADRKAAQRPSGCHRAAQ